MPMACVRNVSRKCQNSYLVASLVENRIGAEWGKVFTWMHRMDGIFEEAQRGVKAQSYGPAAPTVRSIPAWGKAPGKSERKHKG